MSGLLSHSLGPGWAVESACSPPRGIGSVGEHATVLVFPLGEASGGSEPLRVPSGLLGVVGGAHPGGPVQ